jgi:hypothetical protein
LPDKAQLFSPNFFRNFLFCGAHNEFDKIYTVIYTLSGGKVMQTVKLFQNGRSQAVRLPKEFQFDGEDVYIQKHGKKIKRNQEDAVNSLTSRHIEPLSCQSGNHVDRRSE